MCNQNEWISFGHTCYYYNGPISQRHGKDSPMQLKETSCLQKREQPSPLTLFISSHSSPWSFWITPSPQYPLPWVYMAAGEGSLSSFPDMVIIRYWYTLPSFRSISMNLLLRWSNEPTSSSRGGSLSTLYCRGLHCRQSGLSTAEVNMAASISRCSSRV